jgi:hypothetical protein
MESDFDRTQRLIQELEESAGFRYVRARDLHKSSTYNFTENGRLLVEALRSFQSYIAFPGLAEREETNRQHREILRHFQNFVASALALVEATRRWTNSLRARFPEFYAEYEGRVAAEFSEAVDHLLVQDLRNYMLHRGLPLSASQGSFTLRLNFKDGEQADRIDWAIVLDLEGLRQWDGWRSGSKAYLATCSEDVNLLSVVEPYHKRVMAFYDWFYQRLEALHAADVAESVRQHAELNKPVAFRMKQDNPPLF